MGRYGHSVNKKIWLATLPILFLAIFYFYPLIKILILSFGYNGEGTPKNIFQTLTKSFYLKTVWFTIWQAVLSTVLALVVALPGAYIFARYEFKGKKILNLLSTLPFVLPTVVVAASFQAILGTNGLVNIWLQDFFNLEKVPLRLDHSIWYILLAHVFFNYSVFFRIIGGFWSHLPANLGEAGRMLGMSPRTVFFKITLPLLKPAIIAASILVFTLCFCSFGVVLILGGARYATLEVEIYRQTVSYFNLPVAATLSVFQIVFTFLIMWIYTGIQRKVTTRLMPNLKSTHKKKVQSISAKIGISLNSVFAFLFLGFPLIGLIIRSFTHHAEFSLIYYQALFENRNNSLFFVSPLEAILNSLMFASITLVITLLLGLLAANALSCTKGRLSGLLDPIFMLPLSTSAVTLGFGFIIALDKPPLNLRTSFLLVPIAHSLVAFPFVVRSLLPAIRSIPQSLREAASVLGASPLKIWRQIDLPIIARALAVAAVFALTVSLGEFGATVFIARPNTPTMPLAIYRFLGQPGAINYGQAIAMSCILLLVTASGFIFLESFRKDQPAEF